MGELVNLRQMRKRKRRTEAEQLAEANRAPHGLTKAERARQQAEAEGRRLFLDGHRRGRDDDGRP